MSKCTVAILTVGDELLDGSTVDLNKSNLAMMLSSKGLCVSSSLSVRDNKEEISAAIDFLFKKTDNIVMTGGLGATKDDISYESALLYFGSDYSDMEIPNGNGYAIGHVLVKGDKKVFLLPGPPVENYPMLESVLSEFSGHDEIRTLNLNISGIREEVVEKELDNILYDMNDLEYATYVSVGRCRVRLSSKNVSSLNEAADRVRGALCSNIYSEGDISFEEAIVKLLKEKGHVLSLAESCTGGLIASSIVAVSGASDVLECGVVSYANSAKMNILGVKEATLAARGAVSEETAREMLDGLFDISSCSAAISVTGIAGPGGGTVDKPVGLTYIGIAVNDKRIVTRHVFSGGRTKVRQRATYKALELLRKELVNFNLQ